MDKKDKIRSLVTDMINDSCEKMKNNIDIVFNSGCIDIDGWDESIKPMLLPKAIVAGLLANESHQYDGKGTCYEKTQKKEVNNIIKFI
jgi:diphthamide synthase subunit DPH2